jgi:hypothetical protein
MIPYQNLLHEDKSFKFQNPSSHNKLFGESFKDIQERTRNAVSCLTNVHSVVCIVAVSWLSVCQHIHPVIGSFHTLLYSAAIIQQ